MVGGDRVHCVCFGWTIFPVDSIVERDCCSSNGFESQQDH